MTFEKIMRRGTEKLNRGRSAGWTVFVGSERGLAGESGVVAPALLPQSKTRWLQPVLPWAGDTMCRGLAAANSLRFDELRIFPINSNQFQSLFGEIMWRRNQNVACLAGWAVSVYSERWLAGAARAERRALPTRVSSDRQLRLLPLILMNYGSFQ